MAEVQGLAAQGAELVIVHRDEPSRARPLLLPALAGDAVSRLLARLLARLPSDTHAVLLRQADGADSDAWHEDAWHALPETVRAGVLLFSGPTSFAMRRLARARVALVVAPPEQLSADQTRTVAKRLSSNSADRRVAELVNRQARLVYGDGLPEPPVKRAAARALADKAARGVDLVALDELESVATELARLLGCDEAYAAWESAVILAEIREESLSLAQPAVHDAWRELNAIDEMLWLRAKGSGPVPAGKHRSMSAEGARS